MTDISSIGPAAINPLGTRNGVGATHKTTPRPAEVNTHQPDRVELSDHAKLLSRLRELPSVRQDLVEKVRNDIAKNTYETPQRVNTAIRALMQELSEQGPE